MSEADQQAPVMARIAPEARVAIVSCFADVLALTRAGILRFAPHVSAGEACLWNAPEIDGGLGRCGVRIHATGTQSPRERLHAGQGAIEYRHTPDPPHPRRTPARRRGATQGANIQGNER